MVLSPKQPIAAGVQELRASCHQVALNILERLIQNETHAVDLTVSAEQKRAFLMLWTNLVFLAGAKVLSGNARLLCSTATRLELDANPHAEHLQGRVRALMAPLFSVHGEYVQYLLDEAFGAGAFDLSDRGVLIPGAELSECLDRAVEIGRRVDT